MASGGCTNEIEPECPICLLPFSDKNPGYDCGCKHQHVLHFECLKKLIQSKYNIEFREVLINRNKGIKFLLISNISAFNLYRTEQSHEITINCPCCRGVITFNMSTHKDNMNYLPFICNRLINNNNPLIGSEERRSLSNAVKKDFSNIKELFLKMSNEIEVFQKTETKQIEDLEKNIDEQQVELERINNDIEKAKKEEKKCIESIQNKEKELLEHIKDIENKEELIKAQYYREVRKDMKEENEKIKLQLYKEIEEKRKELVSELESELSQKIEEERIKMKKKFEEEKEKELKKFEEEKEKELKKFKEEKETELNKLEEYIHKKKINIENDMKSYYGERNDYQFYCKFMNNPISKTKFLRLDGITKGTLSKKEKLFWYMLSIYDEIANPIFGYKDYLKYKKEQEKRGVDGLSPFENIIEWFSMTKK